eukprot:7377670-Prymnesium_polylepis.2
MRHGSWPAWRIGPLDARAEQAASPLSRLCEYCSCASCELSAAWRPPSSTRPTDLRSWRLVRELLNQWQYDPALRNKAGGAWPAASRAGEHDG